ncbi:urease accessory protein UreF [Paenibacillus gansuensis]|uniref:Urease accessory protein UreF n=1 Tax=Paenibacillus gansuensis TaxID=306542 RepID=A0ABW5PA07_9BACL
MHSGSRLLSYVQLLDSALPIGGFSHSFGLETYVQNGQIQTMDHLESFIRSQIHSSLVRLDGLVMKGIYGAAEQKDLRKISMLDNIIHIQRTPRESREGMHKMGKRLLRLAKTLYPWMEFKTLEQSFAQHGGFGSLPTVHAWISFQLEVDCSEAVKGYLYSSVVTLVNSALRLMSIGQTDGQVLIQKLIAVIDEEWERLSEESADNLHSFALAHEIHSMNHETLYSRLFMS